MAKNKAKLKTKTGSDVTAKASVVLKPNFIDQLGTKAIWLLAGVLAIMVFIIYKDFLLFEKVFLFKDIGSDTLNTFYTYSYHVSDYISQHGTPSWSFNSGMGQSIYPFWFSDPFSSLLYLAGKEHVAELLVYREAIKIILSGLLFFAFLKTLSLSNTTAFFGGLIYSFSSFMILGGCWYVFSYDAFCLALFLLAVEAAISKQRFYLIPIAVFFMGVTMPFNFFIYGLFLLGYIIIRLYQLYDSITLKFITPFLLKLVIAAIIGFMLCAPFLMENLVQILESPRGSGETSYAAQLKSIPILSVADAQLFGTAIMRLFSDNILGVGNAFKGVNNYLEAPMFYCGIPCLLIITQIFVFFSKRKKIVLITILVFWLLPIIFPYFRYAIWLFAGDYYRAYSFIVSMMLMIYSSIALDLIIKNKKVNVPVLLITAASLLILSSISYFQNKHSINTSVAFVAKFLVIIYTITLWILPKLKNATFIQYFFLICLTSELLYMSNLTVNKRDIVTADDLTKKIGYNDYSVDAVAYIKEKDKTPFYRIDKNYYSTPAMHGSLNDGMVQDYFGTSSYNSFNQKYYINYLQVLGITSKTDESQTRWAQGLTSRPILESLNSVKYLLVKQNNNPVWKISHDSLTQIGDVKILKNKYNLPLGYTYNKFTTLSEFDKLTSFQKDYYLLNACVVDDNDAALLTGFSQRTINDSINPSLFTFDLYKQKIDSLKMDTLTITEFKQTNIKGNMNLKDKQIVYLSIPFDKGWHAKVDKKEAEIIKLNGGMSGVVIDKGQHTVELNFELRYAKKGSYISFAGIAVFFVTFFLFFRKKETASV